MFRSSVLSLVLETVAALMQANMQLLRAELCRGDLAIALLLVGQVV